MTHTGPVRPVQTGTGTDLKENRPVASLQYIVLRLLINQVNEQLLNMIIVY